VTLDSLTWLPGRQAFEQRLAEAMRKARSRGPLAVMAVDVDRMHAVNGLLGRDLGDRVLREAAARMARALGPAVPLARLQEDDFAAFAAVEDRAAATKLATAIVDACRSPYVVGCVSVSATVSVGVALWRADAADLAELLMRAEDALQSAKPLGGSRAFPGVPTCSGGTDPRPRTARA
jgi:diguanylate cyclase (GGDEF)-like protein